MLKNSTDVIQRHLAQPGGMITGKHVVPAFEHGLVDMHARTIVTHQRLGHERRRQTMYMGDVVHTVLIDLQLISFFDQRVKARSDLTLTGCADLMVMHFHIKTHIGHGQAHCGANVLQ